MADLEDYVKPQHEDDHCLTACLSSIIAHFSTVRNDLSSDAQNIGYSNINQAIKPSKKLARGMNGLGPEIITDEQPHVDKPEDPLNQKVLNNTELYARTKMNADIEDLRKIIADDNCSHPIVSLHPDYFEEIGYTTDGKAHYRHEVMIDSADGEEIHILDPIYKIERVSLNQKIPHVMFRELWSSMIDHKLTDPTPNEVMWIEIRDTDPGQQRL